MNQYSCYDFYLFKLNLTVSQLFISIQLTIRTELVRTKRLYEITI